MGLGSHGGRSPEQQWAGGWKAARLPGNALSLRKCDLILVKIIPFYTLMDCLNLIEDFQSYPEKSDQ